MRDEPIGLKIADYEGNGYFSPHSFGDWKIAFLNYHEKFSPSGIHYLERHRETDEIFVLLSGEATLVIGESASEVKMQNNKAYIVEQKVWHNVLLTEDAKILIVENANTGQHNSDYMSLDEDMKRRFM